MGLQPSFSKRSLSALELDQKIGGHCPILTFTLSVAWRRDGLFLPSSQGHACASGTCEEARISRCWEGTGHPRGNSMGKSWSPQSLGTYRASSKCSHLAGADVWRGVVEIKWWGRRGRSSSEAEAGNAISGSGTLKSCYANNWVKSKWTTSCPALSRRLVATLHTERSLPRRNAFALLATMSFPLFKIYTLWGLV